MRSCVSVQAESSARSDGSFPDAAAAAEQRGLDGAQYWGGTPPPELTVGYLTTMVGAMGVGYAQNLLVGSAKMPHHRLQFDLGLSSLGVVADDRPPHADCACQRTVGRGRSGEWLSGFGAGHRGHGARSGPGAAPPARLGGGQGRGRPVPNAPACRFPASSRGRRRRPVRSAFRNHPGWAWRCRSC